MNNIVKEIDEITNIVAEAKIEKLLDDIASK